MNKNVLLVDDDHVFNFLSGRLFEKLGFSEGIHMAMNGAEALKLINDYYSGTQSLPDVILLDLNMPVMDGFEFIEAFQRIRMPNKDRVKIVIVSSSQDEKDIARARALGITHYLTKPIHEKDLLEIMNSTRWS
jgi:CheY-like chemotaxis protein